MSTWTEEMLKDFFKLKISINISSNTSIAMSNVKRWSHFCVQIMISDPQHGAQISTRTLAQSYPPAILWDHIPGSLWRPRDLYFTTTLRPKFPLVHSISQNAKGRLAWTLANAVILPRGSLSILVSAWPFLWRHHSAKLAMLYTTYLVACGYLRSPEDKP